LYGKDVDAFDLSTEVGQHILVQSPSVLLGDDMTPKLAEGTSYIRLVDAHIGWDLLYAKKEKRPSPCGNDVLVPLDMKLRGQVHKPVWTRSRLRY